MQGPIGVDESHRTFDECLLMDEVVIRLSDHIDECITDSDHVVRSRTLRMTR